LERLSLSFSPSFSPRRLRFPVTYSGIGGREIHLRQRGYPRRALMLDHLGLTSEAAAVMSAIETTTASGVLTPDLGGSATTRGVTDAILARL
jgi:tartrate dehydrogenase/decarboxylase/D-malate dehydrogenase